MPSVKLAGAPRSRPGGDDLAREQMADIQRARILAAMVNVVSEQGVRNATVARVGARSGVSRRTFYELFQDREDCFLAALDDAIARLIASIVPAYEQARPWRVKIRTAFVALLEYFDQEPAVCAFLVIETLGAGPRALEQRRHVMDRLAAIVDEGRDQVKRGDGPPPLTAEGIVGGVLSLIHSRLLAEPHGALVEMVNPLMSMIVLPYLGPATARREMVEPFPTRATTAASEGDPLGDLDMRLTYRTMRTLFAIAANPGASNRKIAELSGVRDQGQISKLLARLEHLELVENLVGAERKGNPNEWALTERGTAVFNSMSGRSSVA